MTVNFRCQRGRATVLRYVVKLDLDYFYKSRVLRWGTGGGEGGKW